MKELFPASEKLLYLVLTADLCRDAGSPFSVLLWRGELVRISLIGNIGIPDAPFLPEITFFNSMLKTFYRRYGRIIRLWGVNPY